MHRKDGLPMDKVLQELGKLYKPPKTFLHFRTPLDLMVAVILSAQCTDARVNIVTETILYPKYKTAEDYVKVSRQELEEDVHSCGTFRMKARAIQEACAMLIEDFGGKMPRTMAELTKLRGVGRKTASVILAAAFNINEGIAVDTHVQRVSQRLGLSDKSDPKKIELDLMAQAPQKKWRDVTVLLISHGRAVCTARGMKCGACVFNKECPSSSVIGKKDQAKPKKSGMGRRY
jgi:endonuclease-3